MVNEKIDTNSVTMTGTVLEEPVWAYRFMDEPFYITHLMIRRLSGAQDILPLTLPGHLMVRPVQLHRGERITLRGQLRSYNRTTPQGGKLMLTVYVREFAPADGEDENRVLLSGCLCRAPLLRTTPLGRTISDMLVAVNRAHRHADYLPAIVWGEGARMASRLSTGTAVRISGRFQSREYTKQEGEQIRLRTAYEVSAARLTVAPQGG